MRRTTSLVITLLASGLVTAAACSPGREVSRATDAPSDSTDESVTESTTGSTSDAAGEGAAGADESTDGTEPPAPPAVEQVPLPGLLDPSDVALDSDPNVRTGTLPNGLQYYVRANDNPGAKADLRLAIRAGSVNETGPSTGVAHFVEHMLFNGTEQFPKNELIDVLRSFGAEFGADINAYTSFDETVYILDVPNQSDSVAAGLTILQEWLSHATFDPEQVEAERGIVVDEWRGSTQTVDGRLFDVAQGMYLADSAYENRDPIGTDQSILSVPQEELREYYDNWYRPDNAAIVIVGDIDVDQMVSEIEFRFGAAVPRTDAMPARPEVTFPIEIEPEFALHSDPDQQTVDVEVDLPLPMIEGNGTAAMRATMLDSMIFDTLVRRLDTDISAGIAPFDQIGPGTNSFVSSLDAPALYAFTSADRVDDTLQALLDEYARAARYGFTAGEVEIAKAAAQAALDSEYEGRDTVQDRAYSDIYVEHFLRGTPYPTADATYETGSAIVQAITPEALDLRFRARWTNTAPHVIISTPEADAASMPSESEVLEMIAGLADRVVEPREGPRDLPETLMAAPAPVEPVSREQALEPNGFFEPVEIVFPNGVRVIAASNDIVGGEINFQATSIGGLSLVAEDDVVDGLYAADLVTTSGIGEFNQTEFEQILADKNASVGAYMTPYTENLFGSAASSDVETMFQLIHLYMSQPRFDPIALGQVQRSEQPVIDDPSSDPDAAGADALYDVRYPAQLRYGGLPTAEQFATLDLAGAERVWNDRYGDASDFVFAFAGDVPIDEIVRLSSLYLGTLFGSGRIDQYVDIDPGMPPGVVRSSVQAGTGDTASLTMLFTSPVADIDARLRANLDVVNEVVTTRLTDVLREQLGESYSPSAFSFVNYDPDPTIETYVFITGAPDRVEAVGDLVAAQMADLAANGPTDREFSGAFATVEESYNFINNGTFIDEMINQAVWPAADFDDYLGEFDELGGVNADTVRGFVVDHIDAAEYVQIAVLPR